MTIKFWRTVGKYGPFSNFSRHPFQLNDKLWATSEHFFQAMKFEGTEHEEIVRGAIGPGAAAAMGRDRKRPLREDWEQVKDDVMRTALYAKFTRYPRLRELLLATGDEHIIEDSPYDYYWGCGAKGDGKNMLGILLVELRERLRKKGFEKRPYE